MSTEVAVTELEAAARERPISFLLTLGDRPRPHVGAVDAVVEGGRVQVRNVGRTARGDIDRHSEVTLLWPPTEPGGYSLIVDGTATVAGELIDVVPERAVLHRPAPSPGSADGSCASDCVELSLG